jgi:hypothetical protein
MNGSARLHREWLDGDAAMMDSQYSKSDPESLNGATTLMLRHIPNATKARSLIDLMDSMGFKDKIDYLYLPCDTTTMSNKGYAFVNFIDPEDAKKFMVVMQGYALNAYSSKRVELTRADAQGVAANLMRLQSFWTWTGDMMGEWSWPWIRIDGRLVCISAPQAAQLLNLDLTSEQHMRGGPRVLTAEDDQYVGFIPSFFTGTGRIL